MESSPQGEPVATDASRAHDQIPAISPEPDALYEGATEFYHRLTSRVRSAGRRLGMDAAAAKEAAHDAAAEKWIGLKKKRAGLAFRRVRRWAWKAAARVSSKNRRYAAKHVDLPADTDRRAADETIAAPDSALHVADIKRLFQREIAAWSEQRRQAYKLTRKGKKYDEAAEEMGISVNTVRLHVAEALRRLRIVLADYNPPRPQAGPNGTTSKESKP